MATISGAAQSLSQMLKGTLPGGRDKQIYVIPDYQRPYAWETEQVKALLNDVQDATVNGIEHFFGSVVVVRAGNDSETEVIDGQQRLTTLSVVTACLRNRFHQLAVEDSDVYTELRGMLYRKQNAVGAQLTVGILSWTEGRQFYSNLISEDRDPDMVAPTDADVRMLRAFDEATKFFEQLSIAELSSFYTCFMDRCVMVTVHAESRDLGIRLFTIINSRGLSLRTSDLMKARLLSKVSDRGQREELRKAWSSIYNCVIQFGRFQRLQDHEDVFQELWTSYFISIRQEQIQMASLYSIFIKYIDSLSTEASSFLVIICQILWFRGMVR